MRKDLKEARLCLGEHLRGNGKGRARDLQARACPGGLSNEYWATVAAILGTGCRGKGGPGADASDPDVKGSGQDWVEQ